MLDMQSKQGIWYNLVFTNITTSYSVYCARHQRGSEAYRTGQSPVTSAITKKRLATADPSQNHSRVLRATINRPAADW